MSKVAGAVKASLMGSEEEPQLSQQIRARFMQHARKDPETGELYMTEKEFIDAVAPKDQDYVSANCPYR